MKMKKGFSLIEIAIVMVVIGLIIAAVMKGKDVIKNAEIKEVNQNFMAKWINAFDGYYDKLGYNVYGSTENRMILGGTIAAGTINQAVITPIVCSEGTATNILSLPTRSTTITEEFSHAGVNLDKIVKTNTGNVCQTLVAGEFTEDALIELNFGYITINSATEGAAKRNVLVYQNVPVDVAKAFDKLVDSVIDGRTGKVLTNGTAQAGLVAAGTANAITSLTPADWPAVQNATTDAGQFVTVWVVLDH